MGKVNKKATKKGKAPAPAPDTSRGCKCKEHDTYLKLYPNLRVTRRYRVSSKDFCKHGKKALDNLKEQNVFTESSKWVCNICIYHSRKQLGLDSDDDDSDTESDAEVHMDVDEVDEVPVEETITDITNKLASKLEKLKPEEVSDDLLTAVTKLAGIIGKKFVGEAMPKETDDLQKLYKNITYLSTMTPSAFLADRNPTLLSFIRSCLSQRS